MLRSLLVLTLLSVFPIPAIEAGSLLATPTVTQTGVCPGVKTFTVTGATPLSNVVLVWGGAGTTVKTGAPCAGMIINVSNPNVAIIRLSSSGGIMVTGGNVPPALCGQRVCAIDVATCSSSAPIIL